VSFLSAGSPGRRQRRLFGRTGRVLDRWLATAGLRVELHRSGGSRGWSRVRVKYLVSLPPCGVAEASVAHKGVESVAVASGLVQLMLGSERTVLRHGEAMLAGSSGVTGWRNLGDGRALAFWTLRDDPPAP
jgi:hypothetical protein